MEPLAVAGEMAETLAGTTERFLANGMRVEATAKELFLHPNTLRYRLKRFEELTGCDLRDPRCALEVWWALQRARLDRHGAAADPSHM
jgi:DNA-binding PucR family transcriptional regulator